MPVKIKKLTSNGNGWDGLHVSGNPDLTVDEISVDGNGRHGTSVAGPGDQEADNVPLPQPPQKRLITKWEEFTANWWRPTATQVIAGALIVAAGYFLGLPV